MPKNFANDHIQISYLINTVESIKIGEVYFFEALQRPTFENRAITEDGRMRLPQTAAAVSFFRQSFFHSSFIHLLIKNYGKVCLCEHFWIL